MGEELLLVVSLSDIGKNQDVVSALHAGRERKRHAAGFLRGLLQTVHLLKDLFAAFGAANRLFAVEGAKLGDDFLLVVDLRLLLLVRFSLRFPNHGFLCGKFIVISRENHGFIIVNLHHFGDDFVQEITVVGDNQHGAFVVGEESLKPRDTV